MEDFPIGRFRNWKVPFPAHPPIIALEDFAIRGSALGRFRNWKVPSHKEKYRVGRTTCTNMYHARNRRRIAAIVAHIEIRSNIVRSDIVDANSSAWVV